MFLETFRLDGKTALVTGGGAIVNIASVILFLVSNVGSLMTSSIVIADGGYTCG